MTSVSEEFRRVSHHGVREELLEAQAEAIGLPLTKIYLPSSNTTPCTNEVYEEIMGRVMEDFKSRGVYTVGFGDLFLEDLRAWREKQPGQGGDDRRLSHLEAGHASTGAADHRDGIQVDSLVRRRESRPGFRRAGV